MTAYHLISSDIIDGYTPKKQENLCLIAEILKTVSHVIRFPSYLQLQLLRYTTQF